MSLQNKLLLREGEKLRAWRRIAQEDWLLLAEAEDVLKSVFVA